MVNGISLLRLFWKGVVPVTPSNVPFLQEINIHALMILVMPVLGIYAARKQGKRRSVQMVVVVKAPWMSRVYDYESWFHMQGAAFLNTHTDTPISLCTLCVCVCCP